MRERVARLFQTLPIELRVLLEEAREIFVPILLLAAPGARGAAPLASVIGSISMRSRPHSLRPTLRDRHPPIVIAHAVVAPARSARFPRRARAPSDLDPDLDPDLDLAPDLAPVPRARPTPRVPRAACACRPARARAEIARRGNYSIIPPPNSASADFRASSRASSSASREPSRAMASTRPVRRGAHAMRRGRERRTAIDPRRTTTNDDAKKISPPSLPSRARARVAPPRAAARRVPTAVGPSADTARPPATFRRPQPWTHVDE